MSQTRRDLVKIAADQDAPAPAWHAPVDKAGGLVCMRSDTGDRAFPALTFVRSPTGDAWAVQVTGFDGFENGASWFPDLVTHTRGKTATEFVEELLCRMWEQGGAS